MPAPLRGRPFVRTSILTASLCLFIIGLYSWQIEPYWIQTTHYSVSAGLRTPVRLMLLADLHTREFGRLERRVLSAVRSSRPDLIVVVGDCFTPRADHNAAHKLLSELKAPLGVWVVRGNWEHWNPVDREVEYYGSAGVRLLVNSNGTPRSDLAVIGFDDPWTGSPNLELAEKGVHKGVFCIALFHSPFYFDFVAGRYPLCLAGHTHGGQVRLPWLGPLWLPGGCGAYVAGWYEKRGSKLYVTRGVGTSVLPVRFFCRPEIPIITLE